MAFFGLIAIISLLHAVLLAVLYSKHAFLVVSAVAIIGWIYVRGDRRAGWADFRFKFDDVPEPAVETLNLLR